MAQYIRGISYREPYRKKKKKKKLNRTVDTSSRSYLNKSHSRIYDIA
jgi:hypothetical protein